jgi:flagellar biosynthesis chaperone FliJ
MIISEKQIQYLIHYANEFRCELLCFQEKGLLSEEGNANLEQVCSLLESICNQQSDELKVVE